MTIATTAPAVAGPRSRPAALRGFPAEHARTETMLAWLEPRIGSGPLAAQIDRSGALRLVLPAGSQRAAVDRYRFAAHRALYEGSPALVARYRAWVLRRIAAEYRL